MSDKKPMISDEALDAAVDALVASRLGDHKGINGEEFVEAARAALEAAAPYLLAEAWDAAFRTGADWVGAAAEHPDEQQDWTNPYRSQA